MSCLFPQSSTYIGATALTSSEHDVSPTVLPALLYVESTRVPEGPRMLCKTGSSARSACEETPCYNSRSSANPSYAYTTLAAIISSNNHINIEEEVKTLHQQSFHVIGTTCYTQIKPYS